MTTRALAVITALFFTLGLAACEPEGSAEQAGEELDEGIEETRDAIEEGAEDTGEAMDETRENRRNR